MNPHILDARRLLCPLPVIRVQDKVATLAPGEHLHVLCTDPGVLHDIPAWCRINGHQIIEIRQTDSEITLLVKVGESR